MNNRHGKCPRARYHYSVFFEKYNHRLQTKKAENGKKCHIFRNCRDSIVIIHRKWWEKHFFLSILVV